MKKGFTKKILGIFLASAMMVQSVVPAYATGISDDELVTAISSEATSMADEEADSTQVDESLTEASVEASAEDTSDNGLEDESVIGAADEAATEDDTDEVIVTNPDVGLVGATVAIDDDPMLTLDANGGYFEGDPNLKVVGYGNYYGIIGLDIDREEYAFTGWYSEPECENLVSLTEGYQKGAFYIPTDLGGATLYAGWTSEYYTITFDATSDGVIHENETVENGVQKRTLKIPKAQKWALDGYAHSQWFFMDVSYVGSGSKAFKGWIDNNGREYRSFYDYYPAGDTYFTAKFEAAYTITYNAGNGTFPYSYSGFYNGKFNAGRNVATIKVDENVYLGSRMYFSNGENAPMYMPPEPASNDSDKIFIGWYTSEGVKLEGDFLNNYKVTSDAVFEARYASNVTVTFDAGLGKIGTESKVTFSLYPGYTMKDMGFSIPSDPVRNDGQFFAGWYTDAACTSKIEKWDILELIVNENITFYAKYDTSLHVTFNFRDADGEATTYSISLASGDIIGSKAPNAQAKKGNASFTGWYRDEACTDGPVNLYAPVTESMQLYAGYKDDDYYTVTFKTGKDGVTFENGQSEIAVRVKKGQPLVYNSMVNSSPVVNYNDAAKATGLVPTGFWTAGSDKYFLTSSDYLNVTMAQVVTGNKMALLPYTGFVPTGDMELTAEWKKKVVITFQAPAGCSVSHNLPVMRDGAVLFVSGDQYLEFAKDANGQEDDTKLLYTTFAGRKLQEFMYNAPQIRGGSYTWGANSAGKALNAATVVNANTTVYGLKSSASGGSGSTIGNTVIAKVTLHAADGQIYDMSGRSYGQTKDLEIRAWSSSMVHAGYSVVPNDRTRKFAGWYKDPECTQPYEYIRYQSGYELLYFPSEITDLYAGYETSYEVKFDANGGYFDANEKISGQSTDEYVSITSVAPGKSVDVSAYTKRIRSTDNRIFAGWYEDAACTEKAVTEIIEYKGEYYTPVSSVTLYAKWVVNPASKPTISITPANLKLNIGATGKLSVFVSDNATGDYKFHVGSYSIGKSNTAYLFPATIDSEGNVCAKAEGTVEVYAEINGVRSASAVITVSNKIDTAVGKITYVLGGGVNNEANPEYFDGEEEVKLAAPYRDGYDFAGWYTDAKFTSPVDDKTFGIVKNITVYAKWNAKTCKIYYDANGGSFGSESEVVREVAYGSAYPAGVPAVNPERVGYTFDGWYTEAAGGTKVVPGTTKAMAANGSFVRIYAHWVPYKYTIRFNSNPVTGKGTTKTQTVNYDEEVALMDNSFKQTGCSFVGWTDEYGTTYTNKQVIKNLVSGTAPNQVIDLFAQWKRTGYVVFLDTGVSEGAENGTLEIGGSSLPDTDEAELIEAGLALDTLDERDGYLQALKYGESFELTGKEFVRKGYTLTGWKNAKNGKAVKNGEIKNMTSDAEIIILVAQWKKDSYKLSYTMNGGSDVKGAPKKITAYTVDDGVIYLPDSTEVFKKGYSFEGWYDNKEFNGEPYEYVGASDMGDVLKSLNLFAKWEPYTYQVHLDANGGVESEGVSIDDYEFSLGYDASYKLSKDLFFRQGYTFDSWNTQDDGKGKKFTSTAVIKNLLDGTGDSDEITLYAIWKPIKYTIKYNLNGGKANKAPTSYQGGIITVIKNPTRVGYSFSGWESDNENVSVQESAEGIDESYIFGDEENYGNVTLSAVWTPNTYSVNLHYNRDGYDVEDHEGNASYESNEICRVNELVDEVRDNWQDASKIKAFNTKPDGKGINYPVGSTFSRLAANDEETFDLYAIWGDKFNFTIEYDLDGGTINKAVESYDRTKDIVVPDPVKPGYVFKGWRIGYTRAEGYGNYQYEDPLVAWKKTTETQEGGYVLVKKLTLSKACNVNVILTAVYTEVEYAVTLDSNAKDAKLVEDFTDANNKTYTAGSVFGKTAIGKYGYESDAVLPELERKGYTFEGFYADKNGKGERFERAGNATKGNSVTLYAVWTANEYSVKYTADSIWDKANVKVNPAVTIKAGQKLAIKNPAVAGYTFRGWKLADHNVDTEGEEFNNPDAISVSVDKKGYVTAINAENGGNVELEADWAENTYNVKVSANGAKAISSDYPAAYEINNQLYTKDLTGILGSCAKFFRERKYIKKGHAFAGIATDAKGKNMIMDQDGNLVGNYAEAGTSRLSDKNGATVQLYAVWEKVTVSQPVVTYAAISGNQILLDASVPKTAADTTYEVQVSTSITFRDSVTTTTVLTAQDYDVDEETGVVSLSVRAQKANSTNYIRIRQIKTDSEGVVTTGKWSNRAATE